MSDAEKVHRWLTQAELNKMLTDARKEGWANAVRAALTVIVARSGEQSSVESLARAVGSLLEEP